MALRRSLARRLFSKYTDPVPVVNIEIPPISPPAIHSTNVAKTNLHRSPENGFFRRILQRRAINQAARIPEFLYLPIGDKLRERLRSLNIAGDGHRLDGLTLPAPEPESYGDRMSVADARKIARVAQLEKVKSRLREIPVNAIPYSDFVEICLSECLNREEGLEFAKTLDQSGNVIVIGKTVFLRPDQVAKSMEKFIFESIAIPNDPRKQELEEMEKQKAMIDKKAETLVQRELYLGLGYLTLQTIGFMRLTFWELSWDVMEPICFFVTSLHFAMAYGFFLRTSKEPSFESYFQRRFKAKQKKLMESHNFDVNKYNQLLRAFYPNRYYNNDLRRDHAREGANNGKCYS